MWVPKAKGMLKENANPHKDPTKKLRIPQLVSVALVPQDTTVLFVWKFLYLSNFFLMFVIVHCPTGRSVLGMWKLPPSPHPLPSPQTLQDQAVPVQS